MFKVSQQVLLTTRLHRFLSTPLLSNELISFLKQNACSFFFVNTTRDKVGTTVFIVFNFQVYYRIFLLLVEYPSGSCHPFFSESFSLLFFAFHLTWNTRNDIPISWSVIFNRIYVRAYSILLLDYRNWFWILLFELILPRKCNLILKITYFQ